MAADKGYFELEEVYLLQGVGIETAISDPQRNRRTDRHLAGVGPPRQALAGAQALVFAFFYAVWAVFGPERVRWTGFDTPDCLPTLSIA